MPDEPAQAPREESPLNPEGIPPSPQPTAGPADEPSYGFHMFTGFITFYGLLVALIGSFAALASLNPVASVAMLAILCVLSIFAMRRVRRRGFVVGALIGLGVLALLAGLCAAVVLGSRG